MKKYLLVLLFISSSVFAVDVPDSKLTPGVVDLKATKEVICVKGYTAKDGVRVVPTSEKAAVYKEYGLVGNRTGYCSGPHGCEIDHLISLELGGANDIKNLWPQPYDGDWNAHQKDNLENTLHALVCSGKLDLAEAQKEISTDWKSAYTKYVKK